MFIIIALVLAVGTNFAYCTDAEKDLNGKVVIVTGAAEGIGYAIARNFLENGAQTIIILDINEIKGPQAADTLNNLYGVGRAVFIKCDVTTDLESVSNYIFEQFGVIDVLVNNAGILDEYNPRKTITTNTIALLEWTLKFFEHMRKDKGGRGGTIFNLSSLTGYYVQPFLVSFAAAKYGTIGATKALGHEYYYRNTNVRCAVLAPGFTHTSMTNQQMVWDEQVEDFAILRETWPWQSADDVGRGAVQVFQTAESGTVWEINGGEPPVEAPISVTLTLDDMFGNSANII